uniref:Uncharacterized protein n=1 Tax=Pygocentrus nattereri TaxID=42514 RepID=A0AAR2L0F4_PYGNA
AWLRASRLKRAARLLLCKLAWDPSRLVGVLLCRVLVGACVAALPEAMIPVHLLICFWRYLRWFTFLLDLTGLSRASLMLLEAESMKLSKSLVVSLKSSSQSASPRRLPSKPFSTSYSITEPGKQKFRNCIPQCKKIIATCVCSKQFLLCM